MTGTSGTSKSGATYRYYRCRACGRTVGREDVEARVAGAVREALGDPGNRERITELLVAAESERGGERKQSELIEDELAGIEVSFSNIWAAIESGIAPPGGKERIDALRRRQDLLREELSVAKAVEAAELDRERALFWLEAMARGMDDESILRTFVSRVVLGGPGGGDGLSVAFTFDSAAEGGDLALGATPGEAGDVFGQLGGRSTMYAPRPDAPCARPLFVCGCRVARVGYNLPIWPQPKEDACLTRSPQAPRRPTSPHSSWRAAASAACSPLASSTSSWSAASLTSKASGAPPPAP